MSTSVTVSKDKYPWIRQLSCVLSLGLPAVLLFTGCRTAPPRDDVRCEAAEQLGSASIVETLPSNSEIETRSGNIGIGTCADPPPVDGRERGVVDVQGDSVLAILPASRTEQLMDLLKQVNGESASDCDMSTLGERRELNGTVDNSVASVHDEPPESKTLKSAQNLAAPGNHPEQMLNKGGLHDEHEQCPSHGLKAERSTPTEGTALPDSKTHEEVAHVTPSVGDENSDWEPRTVKIVLESAEKAADNMAMTTSFQSVQLQNGDDVIHLALPETMTLIQLLDLVGKHLGLDYVYDPNTLRNRSVVVKLHGTAKGEMKIKDLYAVLETVLKSHGFAMIRRQGKLATIVPVEKSLDADPKFVNAQSDAIQAGNVVVTCLFELEHVAAASVQNLLQNMKLGVAISTLENAQILLVTCYAHRMSRIEQLVSVLDRPGEPKECWFRCLRYTAASTLAEKLRTLAGELQGVPLEVAPAVGTSSVRQGTKSESSKTSEPDGSGGFHSRRSVYLDTDERTNRLLMIGHAEQLSIMDQLIEALDVAQKDLRTPKVYDVKYVNVQEALAKLHALRILDHSAIISGRPRIGASSTFPSSATNRISDGQLTEEPLAVTLGVTNKLLVRATKEQNVKIQEFLSHIDVSCEDLRTLRLYNIQHVDAEEVRSMLKEFGMIGTHPTTSPRISSAGSTKPEDTVRPRTTNTSAEGVPMEELQVVVAESVNSLLVNATAEMHVRIATIIEYVDSEVPEEEMSYTIYPLENSSPRHVADILRQLIQEGKRNKEDKIERGLDDERQIIIVPDPNTFSLVVHANQKEQEWIESLIKRLDKRRPQVLIDVTLVEITRTDTFEYDLNLVASAQKAVLSNIGVPPIHQIDGKSRLEGGFNQLDQGGSSTGEMKVFYSDEKVQALLTAIKRKNYGRVLAKPKILVDDGQEGNISTTDETTYVRESIQVPDQGSPITTRGFESIEASIQLQITPHISEGDLLRLDVHLSREDFGARPSEGAPPDKVKSELTTTIFVPDSQTVILGGLVKLNQTKGRAKVPILGDIPLVGALFRSVDNSDFEKKLYVFLRAKMVRPSEETGLADLQTVSREHREAFEESEAEFQKHEDFPGIRPRPMPPERVLDEP